MPLQNHMKIISVDDHLIEHPRVWQDRLAAQFKEAGPTIIENEAGHHLWRYEGQLYPQIGLNAVAGKDPHQYGMDPLRYEDMIPGCYDPAQRVKDMDLDGVHAALCFPSFPGFGGGVFQRAKDKELALACVRAWNDFQLDEWCASAPDRLIPLSLVPTWDPDLAVAEVERVAARGSRAITFPDAPTSLGLPSFHTDHWERLWDTCEATDTPVCLHFGSGGFVPGFSFSGPMAGAGRRAVRGRHRDLRDQLDVVDDRHPAVRHAPAAPQPEVHALRGRDRLDSLHARAHRLHLGAAPLVPESRQGDAPLRPVPRAHLGLLHRRFPRRRRAARDRRRATS